MATIAFCLCLCALSRVAGQGLSVDAKSFIGTHTLLRMVMGEIRMFSAEMDAAIKTPGGTVLIDYTARVHSTPNAFRCELEIHNVRTPVASDENVAAARRIGVAKQVYGVSLDQGRAYCVFPDAKLHQAESISEEALASIEKRRLNTTMEKVFLSEENVHGYQCKKYRLVLREPEVTEEALLWSAASLGNAPVKLEYKGKQQITMGFRNISTNEPPPGLFEIPSGSTAKASTKELMKAAQENWMEGLIEKAKNRK